MRLGLLRLVVVVLFAGVVFAGPTHATAQAQYGFYAMGTGSSLRVPGANMPIGGTFGLYAQKDFGPVALGADARGVISFSGDANGPYTSERLGFALIGARVASKPLIGGIMPYAEGLVGHGSFAVGQGVARQDAGSGALQVVGGVDVPIHKFIQWRVGEVAYSRLKSRTSVIHPISFSSGIVLRF